jgi:nicotinamidase-related amidase
VVGDNQHAALLVMDVQVGIVERQNDSAAYLARLERTIDAAHTAGVAVIHVRVAFREGVPEVSPNNRSFSALTKTRTFSESDPATQIHPDVAPKDGDVVVIKRRVSAFTGSDLEVVLRARQMDSLVLTGIATSGVVLSTPAGGRGPGL